jgi:ribosome-associated protein
MLQITPTLSISDNELTFEFIRATGPGGQNVNKVATAVQLRFDVHNSPSLPEDVKQRLARLAGTRMTKNGILQIEAKRYRSQDLNRADALLRFTDLVRRAELRPRTRHPTRPSAASRLRRINSKKRRGNVKRIRQSRTDPEG